MNRNVSRFRSRLRSHKFKDELLSRLTPRMKLWLLRLLVPLGGHRKFIDRRGFDNDDIAEIIGLGVWDDDEREFDRKRAETDLFNLYKNYECRYRPTRSASRLSKNIARLAGLINLSKVDCKIIEFAILLHNEPLLEKTADFLGDVSTNKLFNILSCLLDVKEWKIRKALSQKSILAQSGMVSIDACSFLMISNQSLSCFHIALCLILCLPI